MNSIILSLNLELKIDKQHSVEVNNSRIVSENMVSQKIHMCSRSCGVLHSF